MAASELGKSLKGFIETAGYLSFCCWILESTGRFLAMAIYDCVYGSLIFFEFFFFPFSFPTLPICFGRCHFKHFSKAYGVKKGWLAGLRSH